jgi:serine/threonine protein kinase
VYKGELHGTAVAVKVLAAESVQGIAQFEREVRMLSRIQHPHIVRLIGYCAEKGCLVYEVMSGGSLEDVLGSRWGTM